MKFFVTSICAPLALSSAAIAQNISAEDFDLACAVTALVFAAFISLGQPF